jgi:hypothetical protein
MSQAVLRENSMTIYATGEQPANYFRTRKAHELKATLNSVKNPVNLTNPVYGDPFPFSLI